MAIVMQHTLASYIYSPGISKAPALVSAFLLVLVRYAVPMFIFITGLVLFYNYSDNEFNYWEFINKRFTQIFAPYFIWTIIYSVGLGFGEAAISLDTILLKIATLIITGDACYHLWFMVAIFQFYLLFPLFRSFVLKNRNRPIATLTLCLIAYIGLMWLYTYKVPVVFSNIQSPLLKNILAYRDRIFISWFFYFLLGGFAGLYIENLRKVLKCVQKVNVFVYLLSFIFILSEVIKTGYNNTSGGYIINYQFTLPLTPMMIVFLTSSLLTIYYLSETLFIKSQVVMKVLKSFGRYSLGCYFTHAFVLLAVNTFSNLYLNWMGIILQITVSFIACSTLSLLTCYLISKIKVPFGTLIVGKLSAQTEISESYSVKYAEN